ncbi:MAG: ATP-binding protein, partial [Gammaproteobacteria bacterium]
FESTAELQDLTEMLGQGRAVEAVEFATAIALRGYNLFVLGPPGTGRHSYIQQFLAHTAAAQPVPSEWCYVNNFAQPQKPSALELPAGQGRKLREDIEGLVEEAHTAIPAAFESEDYRTRRQAIEEEFKEAQGKIFEEIQEQGKAHGIGILQTPTGIAFAPLKDDGDVMGPEVFNKLSEEDKKRIQEETKALQNALERAMQTTPQRVRKVREKIRALDREVTVFAVGGLIDDLVAAYREMPKVVQYLKDLRSDVIDNVNIFRKPAGEPQSAEAELPGQQPKESPALRRYGVNVVVDHGDATGAPVVFEEHPTYPFLMGRIEHVARLGALLTDFNLIRGGALHRANGGYLVLDVRKVLIQPFAWEGLKQALSSRELRIESLGQAYSLVSTVSLEPEPIPLKVKVVLIGERMLYYLLQALDPEFNNLFKVAADFEDEMARTPENYQSLARLLATVARRESLKHLDRGAVARLIEESARQAGDAEKLSTQIRQLTDILREADYWGTKNGHSIIGADDVQQAVDSRARRRSRIRERFQEEILRDTILIDTTHAKVGQINGLAVMQVGDFMFGRPSRITARLSLGSGKVIDIEREVELGGPIHSKGVLILSNFLAAHYVIDRPRSLSASLVFEQSYGGVEGDSASSAELYALLSALAEAPIKQSFAVTGSVNQFGEVQAIGGVNEKIEGFFDICNARGLTGEQGVLIPVSNVKHLMLRRNVIEAVEANQFHVYPVGTIDQGIELLTGIEAGARDSGGEFPEGSINHRVKARLIDFAAKRRAFAADSTKQESP